MTKSETIILATVERTNAAGALCGLGTSPDDVFFALRKHRFVKRLMEAGSIAWVKSPVHGAGWVLPNNRAKFGV